MARWTPRWAIAALTVALCAGMLETRPARAETLSQRETRLLERYLTTLSAGAPADAAMVDRLAEMPWEDFLRVIEAYAALPGDAQPHTHRAFQGLLERSSRAALAPWPLVTLYSPAFAEYLTRAPAESGLQRQLFQQLLTGPPSRQAFDLAVRLCATPSLEYLASGSDPERLGLFDAWNRRLAQRKEHRPLPNVDAKLAAIADKFLLRAPPEELSAHLRFLASWPELRSDFDRALCDCLQSESPSIVQAGLAAQQHAPLRLDLNAELVGRWKEEPEIVHAALRNYAFDTRRDHSATLRALWSEFPEEAKKARYNCLYAMGIHFQGNDKLARQAVESDAYDLIDVAMPILSEGDPRHAVAAIRHVLTSGRRGHEEALRLARTLKLPDFADHALAIAHDAQRDQVLRQTALLYLRQAPGQTRRELLPLLGARNGDLRLAAIQMFAEPVGLSAVDKDMIGPALIAVALEDPSPGHRQEAIFALGRWKEKLAEPFFRQLLKDNPAVTIIDGHYNDDRYWQYRFRLVALLGLARLNDAEAMRELLLLHARGGPTERMDVLLVFFELESAPDAALEDLAAEEPKLVATAAQLIGEYGTSEQKQAMRGKFQTESLWREFRHSGADDHNILSAVGLEEEPGLEEESRVDR